MVLEDLFRRPTALARFRLPPLGSMMDGFCEWLGQRGFVHSGLRRRVWQVSHFNDYLRRQGVKEAKDVQTRHGERFIDKHLPRCRCGGRQGLRRAYASSSVRSVIEYLSERGLVVYPSLPSPPYQELLQEYLHYLNGERNLAQTTLKEHRECVTVLLEPLGDCVAQRLRELSYERLLTFLTQYANDKGPNMSRRMHGVLRSFFRFCRQNGYLDNDLALAVPPMRTYKLSGVPRDISEEDANKTLQSIDRTTTAGLRDFAILQLLHTYGVRGGQIRSLRLEDLWWRENLVRFAAHKGGKEVIEPLSEQVGESLLLYLQKGRPQARYQEVFLTDRAPVHPLGSASVSEMVARRMRQAGVNQPKASAHAFRHAFATRMLRRGQSLKTIADLLGHRNINTTFIYTKVDLNTLRQLPLDWPEEVHP